MGNTLSLDAKQFDGLVKAMGEYGDGALAKVDDVIHESGPDIAERITPLIHPSGRTWRGKPASATTGAWPRYVTNEKLAVGVTTKPKYNYLYFPDDGSNTRRHAGGQAFFERGGDQAVPSVLEKCQEALIKAWEES